MNQVILNPEFVDVSTTEKIPFARSGCSCVQDLRNMVALVAGLACMDMRQVLVTCFQRT
jgi:hypothetical protein